MFNTAGIRYGSKFFQTRTYPDPNPSQTLRVANKQHFKTVWQTFYETFKELLKTYGKPFMKHLKNKKQSSCTKVYEFLRLSDDNLH